MPGDDPARSAHAADFPWSAAGTFPPRPPLSGPSMFCRMLRDRRDFFVDMYSVVRQSFLPW
jgi:hypothetical protein